MAVYPQAYELPQTLDATSNDGGCSQNSTHHSSRSTKRPKYTLGADGQRIENWFGDSFEGGDYEEDERYATRPRLFTNTNADIAKIQRNGNSKAGETEEDNVYDFPEDAIASNSGEEIYDDTLPANQVDAIYESPDDIIPETPAYRITGEAAIEIPAELYECLDEVNNDIYEAVDHEAPKQTNGMSPVNIYDGTF